MYQGMFAATLDIHLNMLETFAQERSSVPDMRLTPATPGKLMGIEPTGTQFSMIGINVMHFEDGKVVERLDIDNSSEVFAGVKALGRGTPPTEASSHVKPNLVPSMYRGSALSVGGVVGLLSHGLADGLVESPGTHRPAKEDTVGSEGFVRGVLATDGSRTQVRQREATFAR